METRKLIKSGPSSLLVSLPNYWLRSNGLKKGNTLFLEVKKDSIILIPHYEYKKEENTIFNINDASLFLIKEKLTECFLNNEKEILIKIKNGDYHLKDLIDIIRKYPGFDYEINKENVKVSNLLNKKEIDPIKEFHNILQMNIFALEDIFNLKEAKLEDILLLIKNLKKKCLTVESVINEYCQNPYKKKDLEFNKLVSLKLVFQELPYLLDKEIILMKYLFSAKNQNKYLSHINQIINELKNIKENKESKFRIRITCKNILDKMINEIETSKDVSDTILLGDIHSIFYSIIKINNGLKLR